MTMHWSAAAVALSALAMLCGCGTDYAWRPSVPSGMRTVAVPTFRNESDLQEAGALASRQVLREFQREGTFSIRMSGDAAIEVQGLVKSVGGGMTGYDRRRGLRLGGQSVCGVIDASHESGRVFGPGALYVPPSGTMMIFR